MPIYTYRCENCGVQFEQAQKFADATLTRCPECGKKALRKVYTPVGIVFKGSGFYVTDHRSSDHRATSAQSNATSSEKKSTDEIKTSSETKPPTETRSKSSTAEPAATTSTKSGGKGSE